MKRKNKTIQKNLLNNLRAFVIDYNNVGKNLSTSTNTFDDFKLSSTFSEPIKYYPNYYNRFNRKERRIIKRYKGICPKCGAIIVFDENEISDNYQYNEYCYSSATCPGCGYTGVSIDKNKDQYESTKEFYGWPQNITNCIRNCANCNAKCLYRKEAFVVKHQVIDTIDLVLDK